MLALFIGYMSLKLCSEKGCHLKNFSVYLTTTHYLVASDEDCERFKRAGNRARSEQMFKRGTHQHTKIGRKNPTLHTLTLKLREEEIQVGTSCKAASNEEMCLSQGPSLAMHSQRRGAHLIKWSFPTSACSPGERSSNAWEGFQCGTLSPSRTAWVATAPHYHRGWPT